MIQALANILYTEPNIESARQYLLQRGISSDSMRYPPVLTDANSTPFLYLSNYLPPHLFTETLYFPVTDIEHTDKLIGFDARYLGQDKSRLRYRKFKEDGQNFLLYYTIPLHEIDPEQPLLVTEGIIDAETVRPLGFPVISPLTAMHSFKFCCFLKAISNNIYFGYDNDPSGQSAIKNMAKETQIDADFAKVFKVLNFQGKDLNDTLLRKGRDYLYSVLRSQLF